MKVLLIKQIPEHSTSSESSKEGGEEDILDKKEDKEVSQRQKLNLKKRCNRYSEITMSSLLFCL